MAPEVYPVHQVTRYLRELLETNRHLTEVWVSGEVSNLSLASSGHIYFTLKDGRGALRCAFFRNRNVGQRDRLHEGASLIVYGSLSLYEQRGDLSFVVDFVQPEGTGALAAEFERRRARFEEEGLFASERKRALPRFPRRVGVVTSPTGAVFHDIRDVLGRRWPLAEIVLQPAPVQGADAAPAIAEAIRALTRVDDLDVVIVARGGGSAEDLWAFNEEPVIRAIFGSPVPVVSAVGHETDVTLADLVADVRAPTPSAAAELVAPDRFAVVHRVDTLQRHAEVQLLRTMAAARERLDLAGLALERGAPDIDALRRGVGIAADRATAAVTARSRHAGQTVERQVALLSSMSPLATLARGFVLVTDPDGRPIASAAETAPGAAVSVRWHDGVRGARIEGAA
ncbi:MAG: exodeoxyribonuclease VII large subunit [Dehalococcoidia bacterium]|nr:exodeoxyribonuclease VII large subunit [Dehalococcoidia bacterium]